MQGDWISHIPTPDDENKDKVAAARRHIAVGGSRGSLTGPLLRTLRICAMVRHALWHA